MIDKTIHYCWFGKNKKPRLAKKCIKSWKKYCKDYRIIEWNENNFDISSAPLYVKQAYEAKKWAFVTDYARLWALVNYGGVYMDTDVEIIKPIDKFLDYDAFSGFEAKDRVPTGIMACCKGNELFKEFLYEYNNVSFYKENGEIDFTTNVERITKKLTGYGFIGNNSFQVIKGFALFPKDYFCPKTWDEVRYSVTKNTYTIHHFAASWHTKSEIIRFKFKKILGEKRYFKIKRFIKNN